MKDIDKMSDQGLRADVRVLRQLQRVTADTVTQQDELLNMHSDRIELLEAALKVYEDIVSDSHGVDGYHLNGDIALWGEFELPAIAAVEAQEPTCNHDDITLRSDIDEYECLKCGDILYDGPSVSVEALDEDRPK